MFKADGSLDTPAHVTVFHNGVRVQNHVVLLGFTLCISEQSYKPHGPEPIKLQAHVPYALNKAAGSCR